MKGGTIQILAVVPENLIAIIYNQDAPSKEAKARSRPRVKTSLSAFESTLAELG